MILNWFAEKIISRVARRPADFIIGNATGPYMLRWYIMPRNRWCNVYLHKIVRDDDDRALHDHPWASVSLLLNGDYYEITPCGGKRLYRAGSVIFRGAKYTHRLECSCDHFGDPLPCWTLFITGPKVREWGFHCPSGWVRWQKFVSPRNRGEVGRGCDQ